MIGRPQTSPGRRIIPDLTGPGLTGPDLTGPDFTGPDFIGRDLACRRGERLVFRRLGFVLGAGAALLLVGPNGSGKSSLLRLMAGLTPPLEGGLAWGEVPVTEDPARHRAQLHYLGHQDALKPALGVAESLAFWAGLRGGGSAAVATGVAAGLARFRLGGLADLPCRMLSAGQKRRLALARLVASPAPLWLLDEPTNGLDADAIAALLAAIAEHRAAGGRVVLSTHAPLDLAAAATLSLADFQPRRAAA